jgi:hypothetical protein
VTAATLSREIEGLRSFTQAIERGDRDAVHTLLLEVFHPDCEWEALIGAVEGRDYRGRDGMARFVDDLSGSFDVSYSDPDFRVVGPSTVLMLTTTEMHGHESGIDIVRELGVIAEFEDGLVRRARAYESHREATAEAEGTHA